MARKWKMLKHKTQKQFFDVLRLPFKNRFLYTYSATVFGNEQDYLQEKCIWDKILRDKQ